MSRSVVNPRLSRWLDGEAETVPPWGFRLTSPRLPLGALTLTLLSALLYVLAFPNFNYAILAWFALIPLICVALSQPPRKAFFYGWLSGTAAYGGLLYWIIVTLRAAQQSIFLGALCLLLLSAYLGLYWGLWCATLAKSVEAPREELGVPRAKKTPPFLISLIAALTWVALEFIRTHLFSGFPWALLGDSQWKQLPLIQVASITGVYGVSFLIVLMNASLASVWRARSLAPVWSGILIAACSGWGVTRLTAYSDEPMHAAHKVVLLQGNIDQYQKWDSRYVSSIQTRYEQLVQKSLKERPALIIWPETSVPGYLLQEPPLRNWLFGVVRKSKTSHLVGAPSREPDRAAYNSAFSLDPEARIVGQYDKQHLVPFGEIVPWSKFLGRWVGVLNELGGFTAGRRAPVVASEIGPVGVNICYEAIFPDLVRRATRRGAGVIINLTNDGWYMRTAAPYQHFIPNVFRAVENDRWVLRADNTGITGLINPRGKVVAASPIFTPRIVTGLVAPRKGLTPYARYGDVFAGACLALCFLFWLRAILRRKQSP